jgi:hypothetical protein
LYSGERIAAAVTARTGIIRIIQLHRVPWETAALPE